VEHKTDTSHGSRENLLPFFSHITYDLPRLQQRGEWILPDGTKLFTRNQDIWDSFIQGEPFLALDTTIFCSLWILRELSAAIS
jgi:hypothetical protein